jgi:hypothetical protein
VNALGPGDRYDNPSDATRGANLAVRTSRRAPRERTARIGEPAWVRPRNHSRSVPSLPLRPHRHRFQGLLVRHTRAVRGSLSAGVVHGTNRQQTRMAAAFRRVCPRPIA